MILRWTHSRYFLEEDAVDANGKLTREKQKSVNKIGHGALQWLDMRSGPYHAHGT